MKEVRYFYVPDAANQMELPQEEATHALRVLRLKGGDEIFLMDGEGSFYRAEVTAASSKRCLYEIKENMPQKRAWQGAYPSCHCTYQDDGAYRVDGRESYGNRVR